MNCPACDKQLKEISTGEVKVDVCNSGCRGVWFDEFELKKFDEPHEFQAQIIFASTEQPGKVNREEKVRYCPRCTGEVLWRRFNDIKDEVEVDQCPKCSGIWLDLGELLTIRSQYKTEAERQKAADEYLSGQLDAAKEYFDQKAKEVRQEGKQVCASLPSGFRAAWRELWSR